MEILKWSFKIEETFVECDICAAKDVKDIVGYSVSI